MPEKTLTIPKTLFRSATFDRSAVNEEERTVELSISSDAPYERFFGMEILDHSEKCVDMGRMTSGAPLLFNHNRDLHIGTIIEAKCEDNKLRVKAKIGENADANNRWADIKSGVLQKASVGYCVNSMELVEQKKGEPDVYRVTSWEPYEGSLVTIPADYSVGVGRDDSRDGTKEISIASKESFDNPEFTRKPTTTRTATMSEPTAPTEPKIDIVQERAAAAADERKRVKDINDYSAAFRVEHMKSDVSKLAAKAIEDGTDFSAFEKSVLANWRENTRVNADAGIGMSEKESGEFSLLRAINQISTKGRLEGLEKEASDAAAKHLRRDIREGAFVIPDEVANRSISLRAQNVTTATAGGFTVATNLGSMIELLRNRTVLGQLGITMLGGLTGDVALPVQTGGSTAYWVSETGTLTDSQATFAQKKLTPHRLGATIPLSTQFIAQSSLSAESFARNELMTVLAIARDLAGLEGTGNAGQPLGVKNTTGINATVTFGGAPVWADVVEFETGIAVDNADIGTMGFALSASTVGKWKTVLKDSVAGAGYLISDDMTSNGYPVKRTNQITGNIAFFGVWSQLIHAMWAGMEVIVDPYALKKSGQVEVTINELCDYLVRQPTAFNVSTDSAAQ